MFLFLTTWKKFTKVSFSFLPMSALILWQNTLCSSAMIRYAMGISLGWSLFLFVAKKGRWTHGHKHHLLRTIPTEHLEKRSWFYYPPPSLLIRWFLGNRRQMSILFSIAPPPPPLPWRCMMIMEEGRGRGRCYYRRESLKYGRRFWEVLVLFSQFSRCAL